jgi:hypothetical protein
MNNQGINTSPTSPVRRFFLLVILAALGSVSIVRAQTTSFTYQGRLTDGATAANATYDMQFKLFDLASAGSQIGSTITNGAVLVNNGVFTVQLDYGAAAFSGADRYLEIGVRLAGDVNPYTILAPRQQLTSAVYAIRAGSTTTADTATTANTATTATTATNATQLGGVAANQYVKTNDSRLADARTPTAGSGNYIQDTQNQQAANFNISGNGTVGGTLSANLVNAVTQYNLGGKRVLSVAGTDNTFAGVSAGAANTGSNNSFFGSGAGSNNTQGSLNSFFGLKAGANNLTGDFNSFFGDTSGVANKTGESNSFFGSLTGTNNLTGSQNSFFGYFVGSSNVSGKRLTLIGGRSDVASADLTNAGAVGAYAQVSQSNSLVLGSINGVNSANADTNVGIGTTAPKARFHIAANDGNIVMGDPGCSSGFTGIGFGSSLSNCGNYSLLGNGTDTIINRPTGGAIAFRENNVTQVSIAAGGAVAINNLGGGGMTHLCSNGANQISNCGSSLRYKTNIQPFFGGLSVLNRLRPITFDWKQGGMHDLGFGAEDIAAIEPLLVTHNNKGEVEGVKYDRITAVLVNAVKEQQEQIKQQQGQIQSLKKLVCRHNRRAAVCK